MSLSSLSQTKHVSLPNIFSTGSIAEWFVHFDICSKANGWNDETKALKVPTLLEGEAIASWLKLTEEEQVDFKTVKEKLIGKMVPLLFTALEKFHARKLHLGELSRRKWSPATTGPPGPSMAIFVAIDGPPGPTMAAMDGSLCHKWSPHKFSYKYLVQA